jgi:hypothetical protein
MTAWSSSSFLFDRRSVPSCVESGNGDPNVSEPTEGSDAGKRECGREREERTHPLLGELPGLLVLRVPQQLHHSLLVWGETADFTDDGLDKDLLLAVCWLWLDWVGVVVGWDDELWW